MKKGILLIESMVGIFIILMSMCFFVKSYELLNESYAIINNNQNSKSILKALTKEIKYNISFDYINNKLNDRDIFIYTNYDFLQKIYTNDFRELLNNELLSEEHLNGEEYLNNYKNIIIKISKVNNDGYITVKIKIIRKECENEEEVVKASWMDEI